MELVFLGILVLTMAFALGSGYPVAFALPGSAIITIGLAAGTGYLFEGATDAYFSQGGPSQWLSAGVTNLRGVYWEVERDTLIAIPLFIFMGIMLQRSKIAEDLLVTMARLFGPIPGGLGISVVFVGALLAATTGIVGATVVAMGMISLPAMLRNNYDQKLATGTIAASGTLGQIIPPSIVLIILADQLASSVDQANTARKALHKAATGEISMPSSFDVISTSAGEMFLGALVPGLVLVGIYMVYILGYALIKPSAAPAVHDPEEGKNRAEFIKRVFLALVPPLALIFLVLGSILTGIATVNQAGAIGAAGATIMAGYRLHEGGRTQYWPAILFIASLVMIAVVGANLPTNIKGTASPEQTLGVTLSVIAVVGLLVSIGWSLIRTIRIENTLHGVMIETAKTTSMVFIILLGAAMLTAAFRGFGGEHLVKEFLESLPGGFWSQFLIVMLVIFILGFFLDFIEIAVVVVPIVTPILLMDPSANVTAVWLGVMIGLNMQTSFLTPPFGFALFYLRGVAPASVKTISIYKGVVPFIGLQLLALAVVGFYPPLVNYLPKRVQLTSETAPPPRNPALQYCLEEYVGDQLLVNGANIRGAIETARGLDISYLPKDVRGDLEDSFDAADKALLLLPEAFAAEDAVQAAAPAYAPMHDLVRSIEKQIRKTDAEIKALKVAQSRVRSDNAEAVKAEMGHEIAELEADREILVGQIPAEWEGVYGDFHKLDVAEADLRKQYRRAADDAWGVLAELNADLSGVEGLRTLGPQIEAMREDVAAAGQDGLHDMLDALTDFRSTVGDVEGAGDIRKLVSKARSIAKKRKGKLEDALEQLDAAYAQWEADLAWRERAASELAPALVTYADAIRDTLGARQQPKLSKDQALFIASCSADHRNLSLRF